MIESKGGRGGGGSRGRGRGGNSFKKSGPNDPRVGSSVQIFVEGLPQVLLITYKNLSKDSRKGANSVLPPCVCAMRKISGLCFPIVSVCPTAPQAWLNRMTNRKYVLKAAKIPELVQYFSTVGIIKEDRTTKRPRLVFQFVNVKCLS